MLSCHFNDYGFSPFVSIDKAYHIADIMATADVISGVMGKELYKKKMKPNSSPASAVKTEDSAAQDAGKTADGLTSYYETKIGELQIVVSEKVQNLRRLQAQRNQLNAKVRLLREEIQLLQEQGSYVGEVVKPMDKKKVSGFFSCIPAYVCMQFDIQGMIELFCVLVVLRVFVMP